MKLASAILFFLSTQTNGFTIPNSRAHQSLYQTSLFAEKYKVFIDGEAGTTGLQVRERLEKRGDLEIISPPGDLRKDEDTRKKFINEADAVILCKLVYTKTVFLLLW